MLPTGADTRGRAPTSETTLEGLLGTTISLWLHAPNHDVDEKRAFSSLVGGLIDGAGVGERRRVADILAKRPDTPVDLARRLATDVIAVAEPMILHSPVLTSTDLVEIMRCGPEHVRVVTDRLDLAPDIAAVLVDASFIEPKPAEAVPEKRRASDGVAARKPVTTAKKAAEPARVEIVAEESDLAWVEATPVDAPEAKAPVETPVGTRSDRAAVPTFPAFAVRVRPTAPKAKPIEAPAPIAAATPIAPPSSVVETAGTTEVTTEAVPAEAVETRTAVREDFVEASRSEGRSDGWSHLALSSAARWRALQDAALGAATGARPRGAALDGAALGDALHRAAIDGDETTFRTTLIQAFGLESSLVAAILREKSAEVLALLLVAGGVAADRSVSILLHRLGPTGDLGQLQDLAAFVDRTSRRAAEALVAGWRTTARASRSEVLRQTDASERRGEVGAARGDTSRRTTAREETRRA